MREGAPTHWQRATTLAALLLAWVLLAVWQWQEYQAESEAARESVRRQAESVMNVLVGGVQSHRRLGRFLEDQLQGVLDELAKSQDVLAVALTSMDRRLLLSAGKADLLDGSSPMELGSAWQLAGFRYAVAFQVMPEPPGPPGMTMPSGMTPPEMPPGGVRPGHGTGPPSGGVASSADRDRPGPGGMGPGPGGMGPGRGSRWERAWRAELDERGPLFAGGRFVAVLLLDRVRTDQQIAHYAWLRIAAVVAGGLVLLSVALAWRATVRLAEAHGRARLLEIEARHLRELSQAAAGLAHETRNPLGLIRGWTQRWAQSLHDNPQQRGQAQAVIEECDRVTVRINQFLAFTRPCAPKATAVGIAEVVAELAALLEPDLVAKHLTLAPLPPACDNTVQADREMLRQALFNLMQNAIEFSPEGGTVEIDVKTGQDSGVRIEVADRGPGVPAEAVDLLFTPYHTTRASGAGLGLAIVRRIATAHGWEIGYMPRSGGGSIFWLETTPLSRSRERGGE